MEIEIQKLIYNFNNYKKKLMIVEEIQVKKVSTKTTCKIIKLNYKIRKLNMKLIYK